MSNTYDKILTMVYIFFTFLFFLIHFMILLIHIKQPSVLRGFFKVVFIQVLFETIIFLLLLIINILILLENSSNSKVFGLFPIFFNICYVGNILYNIQALFHLTSKKSENEELIDYDISNKNIDHPNSISFTKHSFKRLHIFSFILTIIHSFCFSFLILKGFDINNWYYYFFSVDNKNKLAFAFVFIFNIVFFVASIPYLFMSFNKEAISEHLILKHYSIYCCFSALVCLVFPFYAIFNLFDSSNSEKIVKYFARELFLVYMLFTVYFRLNCYYVQFILSNNGRKFFQKIGFGFKILFCFAKIPEPNFIDYNSSFILQSLSSAKDFVDESRVESDEIVLTYQNGENLAHDKENKELK